MMSIAFKEGIKNLAPALNEIILASNQDVRQVKERRRSAPPPIAQTFAVTSRLWSPSSGVAQPQRVDGQGQGGVIRPVQV